MDYFYSQGGKRRDPRYCRTHAAVTDLFANRSSDRDCAATWAYLSEAWESLARIKQALSDEGMPNWPRLPG